MTEGIEIVTLTGRDARLADHLADLARLRIAVFREFPYLYDGSIDYETRYLRTYLACEQSIVVLARDGGDVIGASTGLPLAFETEEFKKPFEAAGIDPASIFYCGESVLLAAYRGRGVYRRFFAAREQHARRLGGFQRIVLCAVDRAAGHPLRPPDHQPLDAVWRHFGYQPRTDLVAQFTWKDIDQPAASAKPMQFWEKAL